MTNQISDWIETIDTRALEKRLRTTGKSFLSAKKIASLGWHMENCLARNIAGDFVEFGIALGGTAVLGSHVIRQEIDRVFVGYDVFEQIPSPSENDAEDAQKRYEIIRSGAAKGLKDGETYYGYMNDLYEQCVSLFSEYGMTVDGRKIQLVKGLFEETVPNTLPTKIAFAHVDCDWYEPVKYCLNSIADRVSPGGVVVADDYLDFEGCRKAVDSFLLERPDFLMKPIKRHAVLVRKGPE